MTQTDTVLHSDYTANQNVRFRVAAGFMRRVLITLNLAAIVMPWRTIYILRPWYHSVVIRQHELVHIAQIERDGAVWFTLRYLWWTLRYGYSDNPYELEAYAHQGDRT